MKKLMQFEEATMELILFGFDVLTTSGVESYGEFNETNGGQNIDTDFSV